MKLLFMRHGQSNYNVLQLCNDDPEQDVYLTELGKQQAREVANKVQNEKIDVIVVSELPRTRQTAEIINQDHQVPIIMQPVLNDIHTGMDSLPVAEYFARTQQDPLHISINNGESLLDHKKRVLKYFDWLNTQNYSCILTIAHEETMRVFYARFNHIPDEKLRDLHFDNCEVLSYEFS